MLNKIRNLLLAFAVLLAVATDARTVPLGNEQTIVKQDNTYVPLKINLPPDNNVFSHQGQTFITFQLLTGITLSNSIPCARGACVCTQWYPASGNVNTGYYRQCGCFGEFNNYWNEYKPCAYCVPEPNWGWECQNG